MRRGLRWRSAGVCASPAGLALGPWLCGGHDLHLVGLGVPVAVPAQRPTSAGRPRTERDGVLSFVCDLCAVCIGRVQGHVHVGWCVGARFGTCLPCPPGMTVRVQRPIARPPGFLPGAPLAGAGPGRSRPT
eukprot:1949795-Prymnesium_polylepis.1